MNDVQYFYRDHNCTAESHEDSNCICWHDEGGGPTRAKFGDIAKTNTPLGELRLPYQWREKPTLKQQDSIPNPDQHPDDAATDSFAAAMKAKLAKKRGEGVSGWDDKARFSQQHLSDLPQSHIKKGDPVDVANFAMMLHQRGESISPTPNKNQQPRWKSVESTTSSGHNGWCWIKHKDEIKMAYLCECCDCFLPYKGAPSTWQRKHITAVMPVFEPEMQELEQDKMEGEES